MVRRFLEDKITSNLKHKSVLLLGPRQVGKSTLFRSLQPDLTIDLSDEGLYRQHLALGSCRFRHFLTGWRPGEGAEFDT